MYCDLSDRVLAAAQAAHPAVQGSLAQLVERHVYTVDVIGSIPVGPTRRHGPVHRVTEIAVRRIGLTALLAALVLAVLVRTPWVPLERIETGDGVVLGYVVDSEPGFHKVLTEEERELLILSDAEVDRREELPPA
jgi:hypothetical protein